MDVGGFVIESADPAVHPAVVDPVRQFLRSNGMDPAEMMIRYVMDPIVKNGIACCVDGGVAEDLYLFHAHDFPELGGALADAANCRVWLLAREGGAEWHLAWFAPGGRKSSLKTGDSEAIWKPAAKALSTDADSLVAVMETLVSPHALKARLAEEPDPGLLSVAAREVEQDPRVLYPGREKHTVTLPVPVANELQEVAARTGTDVGLVFWAAWEWAKPESNEAFVDNAGKVKKAKKLKPPARLAPGDVEDEPPTLPSDTDDRAVEVYLPPKLAAQLDEIAEHCHARVGWVFTEAYTRSRPAVVGATRQTTPSDD